MHDATKIAIALAIGSTMAVVTLSCPRLKNPQKNQLVCGESSYPGDWIQVRGYTPHFDNRETGSVVYPTVPCSIEPLPSTQPGKAP